MRKPLAYGLILAIAAGLTILGVCLWHLQRLPFLTSMEELKGFLELHRGWAPLLIVGLQCLQVLLAPVPGQAVGLASGYLFGPVMGTLFSMIGLLLGSFLAMGLARKLGRPLVERLISPATLARLDGYAQKGGAWFFLVGFLMPFLPDDVLCFLAGLSPLPIPLLLFLSALGRLPGVAVSAMAGAGISRLSPTQLVMLALALAPLLIAAALWKDRLREGALWVLRRLVR